jgi:hypothetical protein
VEITAKYDLRAIGALAIELGTLRGCDIVAAFGTIFTVRHKTGARDAGQPA